MLETKNKVVQWAKDRNLIEGATPDKQFLKLAEEMGELGSGLAKNNQDEIKDAIGDMMVVLTIMAEQLGMTVDEWYAHAYNEIKDRKGKMVDGVFVKESDLGGNDTKESKDESDIEYLRKLFEGLFDDDYKSTETKLYNYDQWFEEFYGTTPRCVKCNKYKRNDFNRFSDTEVCKCRENYFLLFVDEFYQKPIPLIEKCNTCHKSIIFCDCNPLKSSYLLWS